jgi:hypothetical protein
MEQVNLTLEPEPETIRPGHTVDDIANALGSFKSIECGRIMDQLKNLRGRDFAILLPDFLHALWDTQATEELGYLQINPFSCRLELSAACMASPQYAGFAHLNGKRVLTRVQLTPLHFFLLHARYYRTNAASFHRSLRKIWRDVYEGQSMAELRSQVGGTTHQLRAMGAEAAGLEVPSRPRTDCFASAEADEIVAHLMANPSICTQAEMAPYFPRMIHCSNTLRYLTEGRAGQNKGSVEYPVTLGCVGGWRELGDQSSGSEIQICFYIKRQPGISDAQKQQYLSIARRHWAHLMIDKAISYTKLTGSRDEKVQQLQTLEQPRPGGPKSKQQGPRPSYLNQWRLVNATKAILADPAVLSGATPFRDDQPWLFPLGNSSGVQCSVADSKKWAC